VARSARLVLAGGQTVRVGLFGGRGFGVEQKVCVRLLKGDHNKSAKRQQFRVLFRKETCYFFNVSILFF
jgi:hypothetical protein